MRNFISRFFLAFLVFWLGAANAAETPVEDSGVSDFVEIRGFGSLGGQDSVTGAMGLFRHLASNVLYAMNGLLTLILSLGCKLMSKLRKTTLLFFRGCGDQVIPIARSCNSVIGKTARGHRPKSVWGVFQRPCSGRRNISTSGMPS